VGTLQYQHSGCDKQYLPECRYGSKIFAGASPNSGTTTPLDSTCTGMECKRAEICTSMECTAGWHMQSVRQARVHIQRAHTSGVHKMYTVYSIAQSADLHEQRITVDVQHC